MPAGSELNERLGRARKPETYRVRSEAGFGEERLWTPDEAHEHHWGEWIEDQRTTEWNDWRSCWMHCCVGLGILCPAA